MRWWLVLPAVAGCASDAPSLLDEPLGTLPPRLSQVGLYADVSRRDAVDARAVAYEPRFPLWSNGADKARWIVAPSPIDLEAGDVPAGTLLFKTFEFPGAEHPAETRVLRRTDDGWDFASYRWRDGGDDADLLDGAEPVPVAARVDGEEIEHLIPSRLDCRSCHESAAQVPLGLTALQLGTSGVEALLAAGVLAREPSGAPDISGATELEREVLGWIEGNCTHCHNGGAGVSSAFDLRHDVALDAMLCRPTEGQTAPGMRVLPGVPEESMLFLAVSGETDNPDVKEMPPMPQHRDRAAIARLRAWIESLEGACE